MKTCVKQIIIISNDFFEPTLGLFTNVENKYAHWRKANKITRVFFFSFTFFHREEFYGSSETFFKVFIL